MKLKSRQKEQTVYLRADGQSFMQIASLLNTPPLTGITEKMEVGAE